MSSDRIILTGLQFYGFHGVNPEERSLGQPFIVDLEAELDLTVPAGSDRLEDTVSYTELYRAVKAVMEGEPRATGRLRNSTNKPSKGNKFCNRN